MAMDGRYAENAGAIFGDGHGWPVCRKCRSNFRRWPWTAGMPEMQEQFPAMAMDGRYAGNAGAISGARDAPDKSSIRAFAVRYRKRMTTPPLHIVILAAGEGKRMKSAHAKVLLPLAGRPMLAHVLAAARELAPLRIHVVHGHRGDEVRAAFAEQADLSWVHQAEQRGT